MSLDRSPAVVTWVVVGCLMVLPSGCRQKEGGTDVLSLQGRIERVEPDPRDTDTGLITVRYHPEKHPDAKVGQGVVTRETEIVINGALAKLADLRAGDDVRMEVRTARGAEAPTPIVLKIRVKRDRAP